MHFTVEDRRGIRHIQHTIFVLWGCREHTHKHNNKIQCSIWSNNNMQKPVSTTDATAPPDNQHRTRFAMRRINTTNTQFCDATGRLFHTRMRICAYYICTTCYLLCKYITNRLSCGGRRCDGSVFVSRFWSAAADPGRPLTVEWIMHTKCCRYY